MPSLASWKRLLKHTMLTNRVASGIGVRNAATSANGHRTTYYVGRGANYRGYTVATLSMMEVARG